MRQAKFFYLLGKFFTKNRQFPQRTICPFVIRAICTVKKKREPLDLVNETLQAKAHSYDIGALRHAREIVLPSLSGEHAGGRNSLQAKILRIVSEKLLANARELSRGVIKHPTIRCHGELSSGMRIHC